MQKVNGQWVPKIEWKWTDEGDCITYHANVVGKYLDIVILQRNIYLLSLLSFSLQLIKSVICMIN